MHWAEHAVGLERVLTRIREFAELLHGERWWTPSPLLVQLVENGGSLRDIQNG